MTFALSTLLLVSSSFPSFAQAQGATGSSNSNSRKNIPQIDYEALGGSLSVVGNFAGIELYDPSGKSGFIASAPTSSNASTSTSRQGHLLSIDEQRRTTRLASVQGDINAVQECGTNNAVYFAGSFSNVGSIAAANIAVYFPTNDSITSLGAGLGLDGPVHALACDGETLYVGGTFTQPVGAPAGQYAGAAAVYDTATSTWSPPSFGGFRGDNVEILSIAINNNTANEKSIFFGGSFTTYWLNDTSLSSSPPSVRVTTLANGTISITESNSTTTPSQNGIVDIYPSLGSSLIPISLASAEITASSSTSDSRFSDPNNVFCPAGEDGSTGSTWLARSGDNTGRITARLFAPLDVGGFRIGNTRLDGAGTQTFRITAIPSNEVLTLSYRQDPSSSSSAVLTCSDACPLSHDASVDYEDFLIASGSSNNGTTLMTGFEITLLSHYGNSYGLHMLEMLSSGTIAYAIDTQNQGYGQGVCLSGPASVYGRSSSTHQPTSQVRWDHSEVTSSSISGTSEGVLCAATHVDTNSDEAPVATWYPYIGQDGTYEMYFFTPACAFDATCGQRGAVDVEVAISGTSGSSSAITTVNQEVNFDTNSLIYSGTINPIADGAEVKVTMRLSATERPTLAPAKGDKYYLVADKIVTIAKDTNGNGSTQIKVGTGMNSVNVSTADNTNNQLRYATGYGLFEWKLSDSNAISPTLEGGVTSPQQIRSVSIASQIDALAFTLSPGAKISHIVPLPNNAGLAIAGNFTRASGPSRSDNILIINADGSATSQSGLNGPVSSLIVNDGYIYTTGDFSSTADGATSNLSGRARYSVTGSSWEVLPGIQSTANSNFITQGPGTNQILLGYPTAALDFYYTTNSSLELDEKPLIIGNFSSGSLSTDGKTVYLAGSLAAMLQGGSSGSARITKDGLETIDFGFDTSASAPGAQQALTGATASTSSRRRSPSSSLVSTIKNRLRKRQNGNSLPAPSMLPVIGVSNTADSVVYAGAHWRNTTSKQDVTILGGRFTAQNGQVANIGALQSDGIILPLQGASVSGDVKTLLVSDDTLWVGRTSSDSAALAVYDLPSQHWITSDVIGLAVVSATTTSPSVNVLLSRDGNIVTAGYFGDLNGIQGCSGVCEWQKSSREWLAYDTGIEGVVAAGAFSKDSLHLAGSFVANNTSAYIMTWDYEQKAWSSTLSEGLPGPALSISTDSDTNVFVSGVTSGSSAPYLMKWNGTSWSDVVNSSTDANSDNLLLESSSVQQVLVAPASSDFAEFGYFSTNDRLLMVTGQLNLANTGSASSALFDGSSWYPYLLSTTAAGAAGTVAGLFYPAAAITFGNHHLAVGLVILISMAIALGVVFLGVLVALIIALSKRHDDANAYPPVVIPPYDADYAAREATSPTPFFSNTYEKSKGKTTPTAMLETITAATAALSAGHPGMAAAGGVRILDDSHEHDSDHAPSSSDGQADGTTPGNASIYDDPDEGDDSLPMRAVRYSFDAEREEELSISTGDTVEVIDDSDEHWHIVRRLRDGRQGLVPSAFLA